MSDLRAFQRAIHTRAWWQQEMAAANEHIAPYVGLLPDDLTPEITYQLISVLIQELGRQALIVRALAIENEPQPKRPGRPAKTRPDDIVVSRETGQIEVLHRKLSADEARTLGSRLLEAAAAIDGSPAEMTLDGFIEHADLPSEGAEQ